jgi:hypothetical protein
MRRHVTRHSQDEDSRLQPPGLWSVTRPSFLSELVPASIVHVITRRRPCRGPNTVPSLPRKVIHYKQEWRYITSRLFRISTRSSYVQMHSTCTYVCIRVGHEAGPCTATFNDQMHSSFLSSSSYSCCPPPLGAQGIRETLRFTSIS